MNDHTRSRDEISDFLRMEFSFPDLRGKNILVVGVGGGCDIISAYAISRILKQHGADKAVYANTKRRVEPSLESISRNVFRVPPVPRPISPGEPMHGTTLIDQSVPRGDDGCPLVLRLRTDPSQQRALAEELERLDYDVVFSVDTGADSVVREAASGKLGRDKMMMQILGHLSIPRYHVIVGPGSDGETTMQDLATTFRDLTAKGEYAGCFSLESVVPLFAQLSADLSRTRTPNIIVDAFTDRLRTVMDHPDLMIVPRGLHPEIPKVWLTRAFVVQP